MSPEMVPPPDSAENREQAFEKALDEFERRVGFRLADRAMLRRACTRRSYTKTVAEYLPHNEEYEFAGDKILHKALEEVLVDNQPNLSDSQLNFYTKRARFLGQNLILSRAALDLGMNRVIRLSEEEARSPDPLVHIRILADTFEAYVYALHTDAGDERTREFVRATIVPLFEEFTRLLSKAGSEETLRSIEVEPAASWARRKVELKEHPWLAWGLQGPAIPFYPLKQKILHIPRAKRPQKPKPPE
ncbi:MAG TPA: ribonuclease III domain-containing protein [Candidatus Paceibacterota bacterium]|nr:ribonuclease III domain-containing protein [Candidatus Paceibacterota bacterium]